MIQATVFDTIAELQIHAKTGEEFDKDLQEIKRVIDVHDREFDALRRVWIVKNFGAYAHIPFIKSAIATRRDQPTLF